MDWFGGKVRDSKMTTTSDRRVRQAYRPITPTVKVEIPPRDSVVLVWINNDLYEVGLLELVAFVEDSGTWVRP